MEKELSVSTISLQSWQFDEWFDPKDDLEVIAIDEISEDDYNNERRNLRG